MKSKIEANMASINSMKSEQASLYQDTCVDTLSEAGRSVILKEIDAIQEDLNTLAEQTAQLVAEYSKAPQIEPKRVRLDGGVMTSRSAMYQ